MKVTIHTDTATLPNLPNGSYFHSRELMELCLRTPRHKPYMAVVTDDSGMAVANLLADALCEEIPVLSKYRTNAKSYKRKQ